jgi:hypothetical protein
MLSGKPGTFNADAGRGRNNDRSKISRHTIASGNLFDEEQLQSLLLDLLARDYTKMMMKFVPSARTILGHLFRRAFRKICF